ncbi:MAG TPA: Sec-independent protein translocase protein TatB [Burkholderiales bacterium]|nr:Sec-independent protein translocase protein TatB [Burkholderiales bacterium]
MFDIAFSEILVIAVVALIVIGPERLPKTARTLGHLFGRLQRYVSEVKADISREMELDELRKLQQQVQTAAREIETSVQAAATQMESGVRSVEQQLNDAARLGEVDSTGVGAATASDSAPPAQGELIASADSGSIAPPAQGEEPPRQAELPGLERP